jgi:YVTN family beta-propeller protein
MMMRVLVVGAMIVAASGSAASAQEPAAQTASQLQLEAKIPLGQVRGRIDHLAVDVARRRLFVAELGNDSVGVVDLTARTLINTIPGLAEPQGVGYVPAIDTLFVANARDGSVRMFQGQNYASAGQIDLGSDADNIRVDAATSRLFVGYGDGALAVIDADSRKKIADISLKAHPESFQLDRNSPRIFVNLPRAQAITVVDSLTGREQANWPMRDAAGNFPMSLDHKAGHLFVVFRDPAKLGVFSMTDGRRIALLDSCGDADDLFVDAARGRVYVTCGDGYLDIFSADGNAYKRTAHIATVSGARTSLFVPELDRLFLAVREAGEEGAAIWQFRPTP